MWCEEREVREAVSNREKYLQLLPHQISVSRK